MKNLLKIIAIASLLAFGTIASAATVPNLVLGFGGGFGGVITETPNGNFTDLVGSGISIDTLQIDDGYGGLTTHDIDSGVLNFAADDATGTGSMQIYGAITNLSIAYGELFTGGFTTWDVLAINGSTIFGAIGGGNASLSLLTALGEDAGAFSLVAFNITNPNGNIGATDITASRVARGIPEVPVPAAAWLFGSGLIGLVGIARRKPSA